ncbi:hypothetical protein ABPG77_010544 [Micractinium sp. CCAP 211/92]
MLTFISSNSRCSSLLGVFSLSATQLLPTSPTAQARHVSAPRHKAAAEPANSAPRSSSCTPVSLVALTRPSRNKNPLWRSLRPSSDMQSTAASSVLARAGPAARLHAAWRGDDRVAQASGSGRRRSLTVQAAKDTQQEQLTGVTFRPFEEVAPVLASTTNAAVSDAKASIARNKFFGDECEAAINEQINIEYNVSYVYHAMACFFDRDSVSLPGFAEYFRRESLEERSHAQKLIDLQNTRGGRVRLNSIVMPDSEFDHPEKGDALYAMELALSLEKLNFDKLMQLWEAVDKHGDPQLTQYIEDMLQDQADDIKKVADYVSQLRRVGKGHGVWQFDHELYEQEVRARATPLE